MSKIEAFFNFLLKFKVVDTIIIVIISIVLYKVIAYFLNKSEGKTKSKLFTSNKGKTYIKLTKSIVRYVIIILAVLIILQVNGVNVSSILAGMGIVGVVLGLAIQDWLKDIIRGSSILSDNYFQVGDVVKYNNVTGKVLVIGLKTTKIQDTEGNIVSIANRNIDEIAVISNKSFVTIPMPYDIPVQAAEMVINEIIKQVRMNKKVSRCTYLGVSELAESTINYLIEVDSKPVNKAQVKRDTLRTVLLVLAENNIEIPFNQLDIHEKIN